MPTVWAYAYPASSVGIYVVSTASTDAVIPIEGVDELIQTLVIVDRDGR